MLGTEANGNPSSSDNVKDDVPLLEGIRASELVLTLFLHNKFNDAKTTAQSLADRSMYHAVSYGTMLHLQATATLEPSDLEAATRQIKHAVKVCLTKRRKGKFTDNFSKSTAKAKTAFYASYTEERTWPNATGTTRANFIPAFSRQTAKSTELCSLSYCNS
uniref:Tetratricopeptide repeat (TPR)-like superfamily protein n=1 Tax=Mesocestoides corti TaxID=53468 RepID=A0A5K3EHH2_MESCO